MKKVLIILLCLLTMFSGVSCKSINSTKKDEGKEYAEMIEESKKSIVSSFRLRRPWRICVGGNRVEHGSNRIGGNRAEGSADLLGG